MNHKSTARNIIIGLAEFFSYISARIIAYFIKLAINTGVLHSYHPMPSLGIRIEPHREKSVKERWKAISSEFTDEHACVMDIGCNLGFYCVSSAKLGHLAIGVDMPNYANTLMIIKKALKLTNIVSIGMKLSPENVSTLPRVDYLIMLQIFHHLYAAYGLESSLEILKTVYEKFDKKFFFEVEKILNEKSEVIFSLEEFRQFFIDLGCANVSEIYFDENRSRSLLMVEKLK